MFRDMRTILVLNLADGSSDTKQLQIGLIDLSKVKLKIKGKVSTGQEVPELSRKSRPSVTTKITA